MKLLQHCESILINKKCCFCSYNLKCCNISWYKYSKLKSLNNGNALLVPQALYIEMNYSWSGACIYHFLSRHVARCYETTAAAAAGETCRAMLWDDCCCCWRDISSDGVRRLLLLLARHLWRCCVPAAGETCQVILCDCHKRDMSGDTVWLLLTIHVRRYCVTSADESSDCAGKCRCGALVQGK